MYLVLLLGIVIGRNYDTIYHKAQEDLQQAYNAFKATRTAFTLYCVLEGLYSLLERHFNQPVIKCPHDLLHTCDKRGCKPVKTETWIRKMKAIN